MSERKQALSLTPWKYSEVNQKIWGADDDTIIAKLDLGNIDSDEAGYLLAAAPELLRELQSLVSCFWEGRPKRNVKRDYHLMVAFEAAKKAIRKADGE